MLRHRCPNKRRAHWFFDPDDDHTQIFGWQPFVVEDEATLNPNSENPYVVDWGLVVSIIFLIAIGWACVKFFLLA